MTGATGGLATGTAADRLEALTQALEALAEQDAWPQVAELALRQWGECQRLPLPANGGAALHRRLTEIAERTRRALERAQSERDRLAATLGTARREAGAVRAYLRSEQL